MKDFTRKDLSFSLCGLNCRLCPMRLGKYYPSCGGGAGNQSCAITRCSLQHERVEYCFLCPAFPCSNYVGAEDYDSLITHQQQLSHKRRARQIGIEEFSQEPTRKSEILQTLLAEYNRSRKTFCCVATNRLPLAQIEKIVEQVANHPALDALSMKEKAAYVVRLFENGASREGFMLKLRKKTSSLADLIVFSSLPGTKSRNHMVLIQIALKKNSLVTTF